MQHDRPRLVIGPKEDNIYVAVNSPSDSPPPRFHPVLSPNEIEPWAIWSTRWTFDRYFYLAFLPSIKRYTGILAPLDINIANVPVEAQKDNGRVTYFLKPDMVQTVLGLYQIACQLRSLLSQYYTKNRASPMQPADTTMHPFDVKEDLLRKRYKTKKAVQAVTLSARDSIMAHLARVSYYVCWHTPPPQPNSSEHQVPAYYIFLLSRMPEQTSVLESLRGTWVFDLSARRLGGFVQPYIPLHYDRLSLGAASNTWLEVLQHILAVAPGVPWYLHYPSTTSTPQGTRVWSKLEYYRPPPQHMKWAIEEQRRQGQALTARILAPKPPSLADHKAHNIPWPVFKRQFDIWQSHVDATSSSQEREILQERRLLASQITPWEMNAAKAATERWSVFMWEDNGDGSWTHERRRPKPSVLEADWKMLSSTQKIVDPVQRIWHISHFFPHLEEGEEQQPESWTLEEYKAGVPSWHIPSEKALIIGAESQAIQSRSTTGRARSRSPTPRTDMHSRPVSPPLESQPLTHAHVISKEDYDTLLRIIEQSTDPWDHDIADTSLAIILRQRFGIPPRDSYRSHPDITPVQPHILQSFFKYSVERHGAISPTDWALLGDLMGGHFNSKPRVDPADPNWQTVANALKPICDIFPGSPLPDPLRSLTAKFDVIRVSIPIHPTRQLPGKPIEKSGYILAPKREPVLERNAWVVCLEDATSLLQIGRSGWELTTEAIACHLAWRCIPFHTLRFTRNIQETTGYQDRVGLALMPKGYTPTPRDYNVYVRRRADMVKGGLGRICITKGGMIARLAMEIWGQNDFFMDQVLAVPSDCRTPHIAIPYKNTIAIDDDLTTQEEDILCGVYRVFSDTNSLEMSGKNTSSLSWWPKQELWNNPACEWNKGWWSSENETWFQTCRKAILSGEAKALTVTEWERAMIRPRCKKSLTNLEEVAKLRIQSDSV